MQGIDPDPPPLQSRRGWIRRTLLTSNHDQNHWTLETNKQTNKRQTFKPKHGPRAAGEGAVDEHLLVDVEQLRGVVLDAGVGARLDGGLQVVGVGQRGPKAEVPVGVLVQDAAQLVGETGQGRVSSK